MEYDDNSFAADHRYYVRSLYFDDAFSNAYSDKINGECYREKFRIRIYNFSDDFIRLEKKVKNDSVGYKKSTVIPRSLCERLIAGDVYGLENSGNPLLDEFLHKLKTAPLRPSVIVDYSRTAFVYAPMDVRITLDEQLKTPLMSQDFFDHTAPLYSVFDDGSFIVEVKYNNFFPSYIQSLFEPVPMRISAVSKFALCSQINNNFTR